MKKLFSVITVFSLVSVLAFSMSGCNEKTPVKPTGSTITAPASTVKVEGTVSPTAPVTEKGASIEVNLISSTGKSFNIWLGETGKPESANIIKAGQMRSEKAAVDVENGKLKGSITIGVGQSGKELSKKTFPLESFDYVKGKPFRAFWDGKEIKLDY